MNSKESAMNNTHSSMRDQPLWPMVILLTCAICLTESDARGQEPRPQQPSGFSPSKIIGLFAYPKKDQSSDQQLRDESTCYSSAQEKTGIDPLAQAPAAKTAEQKAAEQKAAADNAAQKKGGRVKGAAGGAAGGAAIGAIADDAAGKGAGAGAVAGTMVGGAKQRKANAAAKQQAAQKTAQAQQQEESQDKAKHQETLNTFKRAYSACMEARDYSIK
jgi:hypothetical protein